MSTRTVRLAAAAAGLGVLLVMGLWGRGGDAADSTASPPVADNTRTPDQVVPPTPAIDANQPETVDPAATAAVPAAAPATGGRFAQSEVGALNAAVSYLELTEEVVAMTPQDAAAMQRTISTSRAEDALAGQVASQLETLQAQAPGGVTVWLAPMESRTVGVDGGFEVSIWYAEVIAIGTEATFDNWRTITYVLVWEEGTWLIDAQVSVEGPVPGRGGGLTTSPAATLVGTLADFDDEGLTP